MRDDQRLGAIRNRSILKVELEGFSQVVKSFLDRLSLTGDLDIKAPRDVPVAFMSHCRCELHSTKLSPTLR